MMEHPPAQTRRTTLTRYQIPTHLNVPDKIVSAWGFGITVRQLLILLIAWSAVANTWVRLGGLLAMLGTPGVVLHFAAAASISMARAAAPAIRIGFQNARTEVEPPVT